MRAQSLVPLGLDPLEDRLFLAVTPVAPPALSDSGLCAIGSNVYFAGYDKTHGIELWKTNGTATGTRLIKDLLPGKVSAIPSRFAAAGKTLFFFATDKQGPGLWATRGTTATTVRLRRCNYEDYAVVGSNLFFVVPHQKHRELWISDGTVAGTRFLKNVPEPQKLIAGQSVLYMIVLGDSQWSIWVSDGTTGTRLAARYTPVMSEQKYIALGNTLVFQAMDNGQPRTFRCDAASGASVIGPPSMTPDGWEMTSFANKIYYFVDGDPDPQLYASDGSAAGTVAVGTVATPHKEGTEGEIYAKNPPYLQPCNLSLLAIYHYDDNLDQTTEMWAIDPLDASSTQIRVFSPSRDPLDEFPSVGMSDFVTLNNGVAFNVDFDDPSMQAIVYYSNATSAGTYAISDNPLGFEMEKPLNAAGQLYFIHDSGKTSNRIWVWNYTNQKPPRRV